MPEESKNMLRYRVVRYLPNIARDEWVNIGVLLEETNGGDSHTRRAPRRAVRLVEDPTEMRRLRRIHPEADEELLRVLPAEFDARLRGSEGEVSGYLEKMDQTLSNAVQFSPLKALLAEDFDFELERLYREQVTPPAAARAGLIENTRAWIRTRLNDVFRTHHILDRLERSLRVEGYTQPGDPLRVDYGYRAGSVPGFVHTVALNRDPSAAKVFAYTVEAIRKKVAQAEFTAITEVEPSRDNPRHQFIARLFGEQNIEVVPLPLAAKFADSLRLRLA